jgi:hypothetical protein
MNLLGNWREMDNSCISFRELQEGAKFILCTISEKGQGKTGFLAVHSTNVWSPMNTIWGKNRNCLQLWGMSYIR